VVRDSIRVKSNNVLLYLFIIASEQKTTIQHQHTPSNCTLTRHI